MDGNRFDSWTAALAAGAAPRRALLRALAGAALGGLLGGLWAGEAAACPRQRRCGEDDCCRDGKVCRDDRCRPCQVAPGDTTSECQRTYGLDLPVCVAGACVECADIGGGVSGDEICVALGKGTFCVANTCVECRRDGDCPADSPVCLGGACVDCLTDADCTPAFCGGGACPFCRGNFCIQCRAAEDCPAAQPVCARNGFCAERCRNNNQCPDGQVCDARGRACVDHCHSGRTDGDETAEDCGGGRCPKCRLGQGCREARDCVTGTCFNGPDFGVCACAVDAHCPFDRPFCETPVCVRCRVPDDCPAARPVCTRDGDCIARCARDGQCPDGQRCRDGRCQGGFPAACFNGRLDAGESDVDCGEQCPRCPVGKRCRRAFDCETFRCVPGEDGIPRCATCASRDDCEARVPCRGGVCQFL